MPPNPCAPIPIATTRTVEVFKNRYGRLFDNETEGPTGQAGRYLRWTWTGRGVAVVPVHEGRIGIWSMYRYPIEAPSLEFPRGSADPGETLEHAALRELLEETGLVGKNPWILGSIHADTGLIGTALAVVVTEVAELSMTASAAEPMESVAEQGLWLTDQEIRGLMAIGRLTCAITIAAWALHEAVGSK